MRFYEWNNKQVGNYNLFMVANSEETNIIVSYFNTNFARSCCMNIDDQKQYFYFLNTDTKSIIPMPMLSLAFGGMYNDSLPYGDEILRFEFNLSEYKLEFSPYDDRIE